MKSNFNDKTPKYEMETMLKLDSVFADMANEIMVRAVRRAPLSATRGQLGAGFTGTVTSGSLRASIRYERLNIARYRIYAGGGTRQVNYAGYQERGEMKDGSKKVRRYTTAGTGKYYMRDSADAVARKYTDKIRSILK